MQRTSGRARILIVDDEPGMLRAAERVLADEHEVVTAGLPSRALAQAVERPPDLVVCDIRMPEMDGFELVTALRRTCPDLDVIFMTGSHTDPDEHLVRAIRGQAFYFIQKPFDRRVLAALVSRCLELRALRQAERAHTRRLEQELAEARVFQRAMLGPGEARLGPVRVEARCDACSELGGDLYDATLTHEGRVAFVVADVRGHGASAALLTAVVKSAFHASAGEGFDPRKVADRLAESIGPFGDDRFITAFIGRLDVGAGVLEYVGAGHPPALLWGAQEPARPIESADPILSSAFPRGSWAVHRTTLPRGFRLLVYTDGLPEAVGERQGDSAFLAGAVREAPEGGAALIEALRRRVAAALGGRPQSDDITVLTLSAED